MSDNPAFVLKGVEDVVYEQRPVPELRDDEVLVAIKKTGICGSDVHYLVHGRIADFVVEKPMVLGHESAGIISRVGSRVSNLQVGDRVAVEPGATCRVCESCKSGQYELCPDIIFAATPPYDGTLQRFYKVPADLVYPLPDGLTLEDGAMMEPLSVGVHSVYRLGCLRACESVLVFGCALGASRIIAVDIADSRLKFAKEYVATDVFRPPKREEGENSLVYSRRSGDELKRRLNLSDRGKHGVDLVIDASGAEVSIQTAFYAVKVGGRIVGMGKPDVTIDLGMLMTKEVTYKGSFRYGPGDYSLAISLVAQGKINLKPLVTHRFPFTDAITAFQATRRGRSADGKEIIKAIISGPDTAVDEN
ncbi:xylitol dehydrogenase [Amanita rubescens]|nr:xylitol dehydrogenase [Amanita rubescens]